MLTGFNKLIFSFGLQCLFNLNYKFIVKIFKAVLNSKSQVKVNEAI